MRFTKVHLLALAFVAGVLPVAASADGWFSRAGERKEVTLNDLLKNPREYIDVEVEFKVYFDATGENFNPYFTRFNKDVYGNFSAWPIDARLYDKRDFPRPYPFFFASKLSKAWKKVKDVDHLRVVELRGYVRDVFKGQPWIEVVSWSSASGGLSDDDVSDVVRADACFVAGRYKDAARLYERAYSSSLPNGVRADLQRRLGDAYFRAGEYDDAHDAYERGLRSAPDSPVLKQGAEAAKAAYDRARAARRGQAVEGDMPEVAPVEQPVVESNGVDEVIRLLEDPAKVQADVDAWRAELDRRAAALGVNGTTPAATAVAGTEPVTAQPAEAAPAPAPEEATEPVVEIEEQVAPEGCAEQPGGCAEEPEAQPVETSEPVAAPEPVEEPTPVEEAKPVETVEHVEEAKPVEAPAAGEQPEGTPEHVEGATEETAEPAGEAACGEGAPEGYETTEVPADEETVAVEGNERVVWVSGQMIRLPRLPFFGCEDVTDDDLRAIIEEVVQNPETDE